MASVTINAPSGGFLYTNSKNARLIITAETPEFDGDFVEAWLKEGFNVVYVPYSEDEKEYARRLTAVKEGLGVGDNYGVIAFGDAAAFCLDYYLKPNNVSRLCALVCYYPTSIPNTRSSYPQTVRILTHLAGEVIDVITTPTVLGLQGKKKRSTRQIDPGIGVGEQLEIGHRAYTYSESEPGFAEVDQEEYNRLDADLAFTRSLEVLRRAYGQDRDLEKAWEEHLQGKFFSLDLDDTMEHYTKNLTPTVTYAPTLSGGTGARALRRFYDKYFLQKLPPSMRLRLISRTTGADRVVDEIYISFEHTQEVPWMLPGVPPTNKRVEIVIVSIVSLRAKQLYSEHTYWDQASVLVQVGLLDPKLVPQGVQGVDRLPVIGRESARRILNEDPEVDEPEFHNRLIIRGRKRRESKSSRATESQLQSPVPQSETESPNKGKQAGAKNGEENREESGEENGEETTETTETESPNKGKQAGAQNGEENGEETTETTETESPNKGKQAGAQNGEENGEETRETSGTQNYEKSHVEEVKEGQEGQEEEL